MSVVQAMVAVINTVLTLKVAITVAVMMDMYWLIMNSIVTVSTHTIYCSSFLLDINECVDSNGGCHQLCNDTDGSYECSCYEGYQLMPDDVMCEGVYIYSMAISHVMAYRH